MVAPIKPLNVPKRYSDLKTTQVKVENYPKDANVDVTPIQVVTLYRPGKHNAFTQTMMVEMEDLFALFDVDDRVKAIVVTGDGRIFCAGADLEVGFRQAKEHVGDHRDGYANDALSEPGHGQKKLMINYSGGRVSLAIYNCRKPTIGALNGSAVGVGITMTLPMAIRIAPKQAKIGFVFGRRGLVMEAASSFFLPRLIGRSKTMHLITTGATYPASHPLLADLFSETLDNPADVLPRALEIATEVTENISSVSWALMKDMVWRNPGTAEGAHLLDSKFIHELSQSPDNIEGVKSFLEKRKVNFTGTMTRDKPQNYPWWTPIDVLARPYGTAPGGTSKL